jgi:hypothetical protein
MYNVNERAAMKTFGLKKLLPILIPMFLVFSAATPRFTAQSLFGALHEGQPVLVYSFVWVPILEISMMIAQHILPPKTITSPKADCNKKSDDKQPAAATDYLVNTLSNREPMVLKQFKLDETALNFVNMPATVPLPRPYTPQSSQSAGILLLISLVFLFKPLLARSDVPA